MSEPEKSAIILERLEAAQAALEEAQKLMASTQAQPARSAA
jgi:hypothetical protein